MEEITVHVFSEMGHVLTEPYPPKISYELFGFVIGKLMGKYRIATDKKGIGCTFHILAEGVERVEKCVFEDKLVTICWDLDTFNPEHMQWPSYNND